MEDFASETDSDYTSYWRDWVGLISDCSYWLPIVHLVLVFVMMFTELQMSRVSRSTTRDGIILSVVHW